MKILTNVAVATCVGLSLAYDVEPLNHTHCHQGDHSPIKLRSPAACLPGCRACSE